MSTENSFKEQLYSSAALNLHSNAIGAVNFDTDFNAEHAFGETLGSCAGSAGTFGTAGTLCGCAGSFGSLGTYGCYGN